MKLPSASIPFTVARQSGYTPLTIAYNLPDERAMLDAVQRDLDRHGTDYALVGDPVAPEIWRKRCGPIEQRLIEICDRLDILISQRKP